VPTNTELHLAGVDIENAIEHGDERVRIALGDQQRIELSEDFSGVDDLVGQEGIQYVEIQFSPVPPAEWVGKAGIPKGAVTVQGSAFILRATDFEEANRWIERFREAGSQVRSCVPVKRRLEDIYVEQVGGRNFREAGMPARSEEESRDG